MMIERIIELQLRVLGLLANRYSYNWLFSWQNKNFLGKSSSGLLLTAKMQPETMHLTSPTWTKSLTIKI